jgi:hypothetical protein
MKTYALLVALCLLFIVSSQAKIRNGYAVNIESARSSLKNLRILLDEDKSLSVFQRLTVHNKIDDLTEFITYYEFTEQLLEQFKTISPDLYYEIDSIKDGKGRSLDVYVKFVPEKEMPSGVAGITNMDPDQNDKDACFSEYGIGTVSVTVSAVRKSLFLLAHEFGHVKYQAPNLHAYQQYYSKFYLASTYKSKSMGHNDKDPSGRLAQNFTRRFREKYVNYTKLNGDEMASHMALLEEIKDQIRKAG